MGNPKSKRRHKAERLNEDQLADRYPDEEWHFPHLSRGYLVCKYCIAMGRDFNVASQLKTMAEFRKHLCKLHGRDLPHDGQIARLEHSAIELNRL